MFKLIIIAGLLFSNAVLATPSFNAGKARLQKMLACETSMISKLSEGHQELLQRLQRLFDKYDLVASTTPDFVAANMGISIAAFYAEMNSLAGQILETRQPRPVQSLEAIISDLENQLSLALQPPSTKKPGDISADKRRMETLRHGFEDDWSDLDRRTGSSPEEAQRQQRPLGPINDFGFGGFRPDWPPRDKK